MTIPLLVEFYEELPRRSRTAREQPRLLDALAVFQERVRERYSEGTLQRLLESHDLKTRRAAVFALGLVGSMDSNRAVAQRLHDGDRQVRALAADTLWSLWFRADETANNEELQRLIALSDPREALQGLDRLIDQARDFAEAVNQRAILYFRLEQYRKSLTDCQQVLRLNPCHFGALAGMAQCYLKLKKPRAALRAFRNAYRINPNLDGVQDTIRELEDALGEGGRTDDKK